VFGRREGRRGGWVWVGWFAFCFLFGVWFIGGFWCVVFGVFFLVSVLCGKFVFICLDFLKGFF